MYIYMFSVQTRINQRKNNKTFNQKNLYHQFNALIKTGRMQFSQALEIMKNQFGFRNDDNKPQNLIQQAQGKAATDADFHFYKIKHGFSRMQVDEI